MSTWLAILGWVIALGILVALFGTLGYIGYTTYINKRPSQIGAIVQYRFLGCPAHLTVAAFGADGAELNVDPSASLSLSYCDLPGSSGTKSSWLSSAGLNYNTTMGAPGQFADFCAFLTKSLRSADAPENTCTPNTSDCLPCTDETGLSCTPCMECNVNDIECDPGRTSSVTGINPDCPIGIACGSNGRCSLSQQTSFSCYVSGPTGSASSGTQGTCQVYTAGICPPPPPCYRGLGTVTLPANGSFSANSVLGGCTAADLSVAQGGDGTAASVYNPCTGCSPGMTCDAADGGEIGTCSGFAHPYNMISVDMLAEGVVTNVVAGGLLEVQWERIQCIMPWHAVQTPQYHLGCVVVRSLTSANFQSQIFGSTVSAATGVYELIYSDAKYTAGGTFQNETWNLPNQVDASLVRRIPRYTIDPMAEASSTFQRQFIAGPGSAQSFFGSISWGVGPTGSSSPAQ